MLLFDAAYRQPDIANVFVLPSYPNPLFDLDGVHLTQDVGPRYHSLPPLLNFSIKRIHNVTILRNGFGGV